MQTVLVVEDETMIRLDIANFLEECGYRILQASNAADALDVIALHQEIDLIFTDVRMPGEMDGLGLAQWIMKNNPKIAVVIASGHAAKEAAMQSMCGAPILDKPYSLEAVKAKIGELLGRRSN